MRANIIKQVFKFSCNDYKEIEAVEKEMGVTFPADLKALQPSEVCKGKKALFLGKDLSNGEKSIPKEI